MVKLIFLFMLLLSYLMLPIGIYASDNNNYITVVSPVRGKQHWKSIDSVRDQIQLIQGLYIPATWLLQYSVLTDREALDNFKNLSNIQELGVFLEVDENLADKASTPYIYGQGDWARADKVLLSGYTPPERLRMIDTVFARFKSVFGDYPKSVGSWYLDTVSLDYLVEKYKIQAVLDVADQYQTDTYGVWGKPWGTSYYPDKMNSLIPSSSRDSRLNVVKIQWAQRDPVLGYGLTVKDSTYSLQANDYISHHGLSTEYFDSLSKSYLSGSNSINQLTVGLEAGAEGANYLDEFEKQLKNLIRLHEQNLIKFVTMTDYAVRYKETNPAQSGSSLVVGTDFTDNKTKSYWYSTPYYRIGIFQKADRMIISDLRVYDSANTFSDIVEKDEHHVLQREIPACLDRFNQRNERILVNNLVSVDLNRNDNSVEMVAVAKDGRKTKILLLEDRIIINDQTLIRFPLTKGIRQMVHKFWVDLAIEANIKGEHGFSGGLRYSYVNNRYYFGWMYDREKLVGLASIYPFFGIFNFPFQTLVRFRTLPEISFAKLLYGNFVSTPFECKIDL